MITPNDLRGIPLFQSLAEPALQKIARAAGDIRLHAGEWLTQEGDAPAFYIILMGAVKLSKSFGGEETPLLSFEPGDYIGEIPLLLGSTVIASMCAATEARIARLAAADFLELIMHSEALAAHILQTMASRVSGVQQRSLSAPQRQILVFGRAADRDCYDLRQFLAGNSLPFRWRDLDSEDLEAETPLEAQTGPHPVVIYPDGTWSRAPSHREVAEHTGLRTVPEREDYDVVIIGGGPAGLAAAVYGASEGLATLMLERQAPGGQAGTSSRIENYLGFPNGLSGGELSARALQQARRFGAEVVVTRTARALDWAPEATTIVLDDGMTLRARTVILATGVTWRTLDVPHAEEMVGKGIYYGAARTEAAGARGKDVYLIGGGNSAGQAAMFFADYARTVTLLIRADDIARGMSQYLIKQLAAKANVTICVRSQVVAVHGTSHLEAITVETLSSDPSIAPTRAHLETNALFTFIGADAITDWLPDSLGRDARGFILTGLDARACGKWPLERDPYLLETSLPGVFAAGDVRHDSVKRVASGVGEGSMAIAFIHQYLALMNNIP